MPGRTFNKRIIRNLVQGNKLKTKLVQSKKSAKEIKIKERIHENAFKFLSSIGQILDDVSLIMSKVGEDDVPVAVTAGDEERLSNEQNQEIADMLDDDANRCVVAEEGIVEVTTEQEGSKKLDEKISKKLGYNRFMIEDPWVIGKDRIEKAEYKRVRNDARERALRKRAINKVVVEKVRMREARGSAFKQEIDVEVPPWTLKMHELLPDLY